jgi:hypothetical protein
VAGSGAAAAARAAARSVHAGACRCRATTSTGRLSHPTLSMPKCPIVALLRCVMDICVVAGGATAQAAIWRPHAAYRALHRS